MNISIEGFTKKQKARITPLIKSASRIAPWWLYTINVERVTEIDDGAEMECYPQKDYRRITITIPKSTLSFKDDYFMFLLVHEMSHCYNEPLIYLMDALEEYITDESHVKVMRKNMTRYIEEQTQDLAIMFGEIIG